MTFFYLIVKLFHAMFVYLCYLKFQFNLDCDNIKKINQG